MLESLFNKVPGLKVCNSIKKRLQHRCLPEKFANFLRTPFLQNNFRGYFLSLTLVFKNVFKNWCDCQQQIPCSAAKKYWLQRKVRRSHHRCSVKKTSNFIRKRLQYCDVDKNTRSSHQRRSIIKGVLISFAKFIGTHLCQSLFLNKVQASSLWFAKVCLLFLS